MAVDVLGEGDGGTSQVGGGARERGGIGEGDTDVVGIGAGPLPCGEGVGDVGGTSGCEACGTRGGEDRVGGAKVGGGQGHIEACRVGESDVGRHGGRVADDHVGKAQAVGGKASYGVAVDVLGDSQGIGAHGA